VITLAHRRAVDRVRTEVSARRREIIYGTTSVERASDVVVDAVLAGDERGRVVRCLGALSALQRQAVEMAYYDGLTYREVAQRLSASLGTVKSRLRDGLRTLRGCVGAT
jgi:RNA polymerase sigma-70 factor (ECF subfamily)